MNAWIPAAMVQSEYFRSQMDDLDETQRQRIWRSLNRARDGKPTPGVERPWGADSEYLCWPCGEYRVVLRRMKSQEVAGVEAGEEDEDTDVEGVEAGAGDPRPAFYLIRAERSDGTAVFP